ncbi:MAG: hypothetical protein K9G33_15405 [Sneathiella sp.]|nr:hypothetical protein [Sneathiella sp.]
MVRSLQRFRSAEEGAAVLIFALGLFIVIGGMAFAIDVSRIYAVKSRLSVATEAAAVAAATNLHFLDGDALGQLATQTLNANFGQMNLLAFKGDTVAQPVVTVTPDVSNGEVTVSAEGQVTTTLLRMLNFFDDVTVTEAVTARQQMPETELALVLDASAASKASGRLEPIKAAAQTFIAALELEVRQASGVKWALVPFGNSLVNVAPHQDWVEAASWPVNLPPDVPGTTSWTGDLAEDRWCVGARSGAAGSSDAPPASDLFPLVLEISSENDPVTGLPHFTNVTTPDCRNERIQPLTSSTVEISTEVAALTGVGDTASGRAMLWAERVLSPLWQGVWDGDAGSPVAYNDPTLGKTAVLVVASDNAEAGEDTILGDTCARMTSNGITLYAIDYLTSSATADIVKACASSAGHYFRVTSDTELIDAFFSIAKFLTVVQFPG